MTGKAVVASLILLVAATETGGSVVYPPTSSWAATGTGETGEEYSVGGVQRSLHYPGSHPGYGYNGYGQQGEGSAGSRVVDYEMGEPRSRYQYYPEADQAAPVVPRRYQDRLWWPPVPLPVLGTRTDSYLPRPVPPEAQHSHPGMSPRQRERSLGRGEIEGSGRGQHGVAGERRIPHDDSIISVVRGQGALAAGQDYQGGWPVPPSTTPASDSRSRHNSGFDSLLQMITQGEQSPGTVTTAALDKHKDQKVEADNSFSSLEGRAGRGKKDKAPVLARVGASKGPKTPVTPTILLGSIMLLIILVVVMVALRVHWRDRLKAEEEWQIRSPTVQPPTPAPTATADPTSALVQAPPSPAHHLDPLRHLHAEPIRIKAKGLLERRGSNTSLTLELAPTCPPPEVSSPPRHCTPEEFLMTAGNRMSRRQLRLCLKEVRTLHAEFWEVPLNHPEKCDVPGWASKNRYRTVLPNEATRVLLHTAHPAAQYINANFVRGYDGEERAYIVTQGPLPHTVADMWRLVLQERAPAIVMITRLREKQRVKCEPYVPTHSGLYGDITVTVRQVINKSGYTIRQLFLQRGDESHETLHFWYTAWPDHKTPSEADQLLAMALQVEHVRKSGCGVALGPVVVHCSAGIGRSGCFVAISIAISQLLEEDCVDILGIVCQMRLDRGGMVQTGEQYEFIHRAVALYAATLPSVCNGK